MLPSFTNWLIRRMDESLLHQEPIGGPNQSGRRELVVLVGPPAVGKSTFVAKKFPPGETAVVNRDVIVDRVAQANGLTYDELFANPPPESKPGAVLPGMEKYGLVIPAPPSMAKYTPLAFEVVARCNDQVKQQLDQAFSAAINGVKKYVVVDMTHMTAANRREVMGRVVGREQEFHKRAVVFSLAESDMPQLLARLKTRNEESAAAGRPKTIPEGVIKKMVAAFQAVSPEEGFDEVETVSTFRA